jgi:hypothetical protein
VKSQKTLLSPGFWGLMPIDLQHVTTSTKVDTL